MKQTYAWQYASTDFSVSRKYQPTPLNSCSSFDWNRSEVAYPLILQWGGSHISSELL
jgi:hypothetical protein